MDPQQLSTQPTAHTHSCPRCGKPAKCDQEKGKSTCWCFSVPTQENWREPFQEGDKCYCRQCLMAKRTESVT